MFFKTKVTEPSETGRRLFGVDLEVYNYLGWTQFEYSDTERTWQCHFFLSKDHSTRKIKITGNSSSEGYLYHSYYTKSCAIWEAGEFEYYQCAYGYQSKWLQEHMLDKFGVVWDKKKKWWVSTEASKYEQAKRQQKSADDEPEETVVVTVEENVVTVNFGDKK